MPLLFISNEKLFTKHPRDERKPSKKSPIKSSWNKIKIKLPSRRPQS